MVRNYIIILLYEVARASYSSRIELYGKSVNNLNVELMFVTVRVVEGNRVNAHISFQSGNRL